MALLNLFFPKRCLSCKREGQHLCEDCLSLISVSGKPSLLPARSAMSGLFCATSFEDPLVQQMVRHVKYPPFLRDLAKPLAFLIVSHFAIRNNNFYTPHLLCPVPLHKKRLKWRGYNHSEEIAGHLSSAWDIPSEPRTLIRTKHTSPQVELSKEKRQNNIAGAFAAPNPGFLAGKTVFLVDDVYTTGATMEEAAQTLKKSGAKAVYGVCVARG